MQQTYSNRYRELWSRHWWWRVRHRFVMSALEEVCDADTISGADRLLLDVGCAGGVAFDDFSRFGRMRGVEPDEQLIDPESRWTREIDVVRFDSNYHCQHRQHVIFMLDVLEHIEDDSAALSKAFELLRPNGTLILTVPALPSLWSDHDDVNHHFRRYTRASLLTRFRESGFEVSSCRYAFGWSLPLLYARRVVAQGRASAYVVGVPPRWINASFYLLSRMEQAVCRTFNCGPPAGSSLFVIARRPANESVSETESTPVDTVQVSNPPELQTTIAG